MRNLITLTVIATLSFSSNLWAMSDKEKELFERIDKTFSELDKREEKWKELNDQKLRIEQEHITLSKKEKELEKEMYAFLQKPFER